MSADKFDASTYLRGLDRPLVAMPPVSGGLAGDPGYLNSGGKRRGPELADGGIYELTASHVTSVTTSETGAGYEYSPFGAPEDLGKIQAKCLQTSYRNGCKIYVWEQVPGGKFCRFETYGLPEGLERVSAGS